jgi:hypothetical protein
MLLCIVHESKNLVTRLTALEWKVVIKREAYAPYRKIATAIYEEADNVGMICPDISIRSKQMIMRYDNGNKFVAFSIDKKGNVEIRYGIKKGESRIEKWSDDIIPSCSEYLYA